MTGLPDSRKDIADDVPGLFVGVQKAVGVPDQRVVLIPEETFERSTVALTDTLDDVSIVWRS
jgi:hypothetical protein